MNLWLIIQWTDDWPVNELMNGKSMNLWLNYQWTDDWTVNELITELSMKWYLVFKEWITGLSTDGWPDCQWTDAT